MSEREEEEQALGRTGPMIAGSITIQSCVVGPFSCCGEWRKALGLFLLLFLAACGRAPLQQQEAYVFGTRVEVLVADADPARGRDAIAAVLREFDRLHRAYHAWQPSELTTLNEAIAASQPRAVSPELARLIRNAQTFSAQSGGLFDPGIGQLVALWGFQSDEFKPALPDPAAIEAWRAAPSSIADLAIDAGIVSSKRALALDFGGYLKGVALDRAATMLKQAGIQNALINIGGNVLALGNKGGRAWKIGIQHPRQPGTIATLELRDGEAVGTSGDYQRYFEWAGQRYCHVLDPRTGAPVAHTQSVTVLIAPGEDAGARSDAFSKPLFIAGKDAWRTQAEKLGITQALRIDADGTASVIGERMRVM